MNITLVFRQRLSKIEEQVNARSLRERILLLMAVVMLLFILWRNLIANYLSTSTEQIVANKERLSTQINLMQGQIESLSEAIKHDSTVALERRLKESISKNTSIKEKINQYVIGLAASGEMITVLKNLLTAEDRIKIEKIGSIDDKQIFSGKFDIPLYDKGIQLEFEGDYSSTVAFLQKLEKSDIKLLWDMLTYEVIKYPIAKITMVVHTLGAEKGWLHV